MTITERGWAGHFICSGDCLFRRNTLIESGERRIVVATVGNEYIEGRGHQTIGSGNRVYETMAFEAKFNDPYWEADILKSLAFESEWSISCSPRKMARDLDLRANEMHEAVVREFVDRLKIPANAAASLRATLEKR